MGSCLVSLGSNLGDRALMLSRACEQLGQCPGIRVLAVSSAHPTAPVGGPAGQAPFLNAVLRLETTLGPQQVLDALQQIEHQLGRTRQRRWEARTIDLDLLLFDEQVLHSPRLEIPHPRMAFRRFILEPAVEVASEMVHPVIGWTIGRLLEHLNTAPHYLALAGCLLDGKRQLAQHLQRTYPGSVLADPVKHRWQRWQEDPPRAAWRRESILLEGRARQLAALQQRLAAGARLAISDFWLDQSLVFARLAMPAEQAEAFEQQWAAARRELPRPKLLVLLEAPPAVWKERAFKCRESWQTVPSQAWFQSLQQSLIQQAQLPDQGPLLRLDATDPERVRQEVSAAVAAMEDR